MKAIDFVVNQHNIGQDDLGLAAQKNRIRIIQAVRILSLSFILFIAIAFQYSQSDFLNPDVWVPVYYALFASFALNASFFLVLSEYRNHWIANALLFAVDALLITSLIYYTGINQSIFLFLYLVYIILCGLIYNRRGALLMSLWTSSLFSFLLIIGPMPEGKNLYFSIGLNNLAFFSVAFLSGYLSEQINLIGGVLKEKGRELEVLKDFNQLIVDSVGTGFITLDKDLLITHANASSKSLLSEQQLVNRSLEEIFPLLAGSLNTENEIQKYTPLRFEESFINYREERLLMDMLVSKLLDKDNNFLGFVVMFQDLTEMRRMEFNLRQQEKLAAVGQLAAGIAHEIRNPLASISGSIQMLKASNLTASSDDQKLMKIVLREIDRLNDLITEFLDFVRPETMTEEVIQVNGVINEVVDMANSNPNLSDKVEQDIRLISKHNIMGSHDKLKQALLNIIINAYQSMEATESTRIVIETFDEDESVNIRIKDSGCGMNENNLRRLFEPFHTTKNKGTGLGMAVTHRIVENHGGQIFVESEEGVGTQFLLKFPFAVQSKEEKTQLRA